MPARPTAFLATQNVNNAYEATKIVFIPLRRLHSIKLLDPEKFIKSFLLNPA